MTHTTTPKSWDEYIQKTREFPPSELILLSLDLVAATPPLSMSAIDLGCGSGRDTRELLKRGWSVLAIDGDETGLTALREDSGGPSSLTTQLSRFEDISSLPSAGLIHAAFSLPFCPPSHFQRLWKAILGALVPGSILSVHLFGDRDGWSKNPRLSIFSRQEVEGLLTPLQVLSLEEREYEGPLISGEPKHWHLFSIVATRST